MYGIVEMKNSNGFLNSVKKSRLEIIEAGYAEVDATWNGTVMSPPYSRLYYVESGEFYIRLTDGNEITLSEQNAYLIPASHSYSYGCNGKMTHCFFHVFLPSYDGRDMLEECLVAAIHVGKEKIKNVKDLLSRNDIISRFALEGEILSTVSSLIKAGTRLPTAKKYSSSVRIAIDYINENLSFSLRISDVADAVHISESSLSKKFKQETEMSVGSYINAALMKKAEREITKTDKTVAEISDSLGFSDQLYFSRCFKTYFGLCPREYKRRGLV